MAWCRGHCCRSKDSCLLCICHIGPTCDREHQLAQHSQRKPAGLATTNAGIKGDKAITLQSPVLLANPKVLGLNGLGFSGVQASGVGSRV